MMKPFLAAIVLSLCCLAVQAQTPSLVNAVSGSNSLAASTGHGAQEGSGCATNSYCIHVADPSLAGNTIVVFVTYADSPSATISVSDDKSNSYSAGPTAHDTVNGRWVASYYVENAAAGTHNITITWSASVVYMSAMVQQWMNTGALDASSGSAVANGATTVSSGDLTPASTNDLIIQYACRTQNIGATAYTAGSQANIAWEKVDGSSDRLHGCIAQWGVYNSNSAINPTLTWAGGSGGATIALAFKAAAQGTQASGMHIVAMEHFSSPNNVTGPIDLDLPSSNANNLIVLMTIGGGTSPQSVTGVADSNGNSWSTTGAANISGISSSVTSCWYVANNNFSPSATLTINTNGNGDTGGILYIISGAAASPFGTRVTDITAQSSPGNLSVVNITPGNTSGIVLGTLGVNFNTVGGIASPSGAIFDSDSYGGENISGPISVDENNGWGHLYNSSDSSLNWTWSFWSSSLATGEIGGEADSFSAGSAAATVQPPTNLKVTVQ